MTKHHLIKQQNRVGVRSKASPMKKMNEEERRCEEERGAGTERSVSLAT